MNLSKKTPHSVRLKPRGDKSCQMHSHSSSDPQHPSTSSRTSLSANFARKDQKIKKEEETVMGSSRKPKTHPDPKPPFKNQRPSSPHARPTRSSRTFKHSSEHDSDESSYQQDENSPHKSAPRRSTSYASPLEFHDPTPLNRLSTPLTRQNLESLLKDLEKVPETPKAAPHSVKSSAEPLTTGAATASRRSATNRLPQAMPKPKSAKKSSSDKKKSKPDPDSHPLNLPPDELRRLSAAMAREEARNSTPMDVDDAPAVNGSSQLPTPSHDAPGAFPDEETNGVHEREEKSPTPPPHKTPPPPKVDPEACKAAGNKFFKAKDYDRAIQEYTKGEYLSTVSLSSADQF